MARLANAANLGYVPLPSAAAQLLVTYIGLPDGLTSADHAQLRLCDPCVGEGQALATIADALAIPITQRYACDIHEGRVAQAQSCAAHVLCGDALKSLVASERAFQLAYLNPPFDHDDAREGGGRLEVKFFDRVIRDGRWVQVGGLVLLVAPQHTFVHASYCQSMACCLDDVHAYVLPDAIRRYREVVVFGVVRKRERRGLEQDAAVDHLHDLFGSDLPTLATQTEPRYVLPIPDGRRIIWKLAATGSSREAQQDVACTGGAWASDAYHRLQHERAPILRPVMPMKRAYIGFAIGNGRIDGTTLPIGGVAHMVKGSTIEQTLTETETHSGDGSTTTIERSIRQQVACITGLALSSGSIRQFVGAEGLTALMDNADTAKAVTDAAIAALPPLYTFDIEPWLAQYLAAIRPPQALPGYPRCVIPMQQHLVAAAFRGLNATDPAWRRVRAAHIFSATMGCGKSLLGTLTADAQVQQLTGMWRRWQTDDSPGDGSITVHGIRRAPVVIVSAPGHLVGTQQQVDQYLESRRGALPQWYAEWRGLLGDRYHMQVLETPADVGAFFRGAVADPTTPRVGFLADTVMKLDSGFVLGAEALQHNRWQHRRAQHLHDADAQERAAFKQLRTQHRTQTQAAATATAGADDLPDDLAAAIAAAATPADAARLRRMERDCTVYGLGRATWKPLMAPDGTPHTHPDGSPMLMLVRVGQQQMIRNGICCPHCGRMARAANGDPLAAHTLKQHGLARIRCAWCGEKVGQRAREQDNVKDRTRAIFNDPAWRARTITYQVSNDCACTVPERTTRFRPITRLADGTILHRPRYPLPHGATVEWIEEVPRDYAINAALPLRYLLPPAQRVVVDTPLRHIPWGDIPRSNPRYALAKLIRRQWKGWVDVYVADEFHECAGRSTAIGAAFGALCAAARFRVAMSGTGMNGYASSLYYPLLRLGVVPVQDRYGWDDEQRFVEECGILMEIRRSTQRVTRAGHFSGEPHVETSLKQMPGMTALLGEIFCNCAAIVDLPDMAFHLPNYDEDAVVLPLPDHVATHYDQLETAGKEIVSWGGHDALSAYLQSTLSYPYMPWEPFTIESANKVTRGSDSWAGPYHSTILARDTVLPHHTWLAAFAAQEALAGRRVLVGVEHTGTRDILPDIAEKITTIARTEHGVTLRVAVLRSSVARGSRSLWLQQREAEGVHVVLCHPKLVKTGLNLIGFPSIVVLEPNYSLEVVAQFIRRSFRPTQIQPVTVRFVCYANTMSERAIDLVAQKMGTLALLNGNEFMTGISAIGDGMSMIQQLAQAVVADQPTDQADLRAAFNANAQTYRTAMTLGAAGFLGVDTSQVVTQATVSVPSSLPARVDGSSSFSTLKPRPHVPLFGQTLAAAVSRRKAATHAAAPVQHSLFMLLAAEHPSEVSSAEASETHAPRG